MKNPKATIERKPEEPKQSSGPVKQHPLMHPLHTGKGTDHRDISMKEKYNSTGPHLPMPEHQHPLHHPHVDVEEKHHDHMKKGSY